MRVALLIVAVIIVIVVLVECSARNIGIPDGMEYHRKPVAGRNCVQRHNGGYYCDKIATVTP